MKLLWAKKFSVFHGTLLSLVASFPVAAQIKPDATLPHNSRSSQLGNVIQIDGGTRAGNNLFHSFTQFNVPTGGTAFFNNAVDVNNIFSRVTGSSASSLDGILKANGTASLFLLNPNGIIFGKNAQFNIGGSFLGTTASSIKFADGAQFSTTTPETPSLLTVHVPVGLGFGSSAGNINVIQAKLQVPTQKTLALLGGDVTLEGSSLTAAGGRIELGSVANSGVVSLNTAEKGFALGYTGVSNFQDIQLSQQTLVSVNGEGGGDIQVIGRAITLTDGSRLLARTLGAKAGGNLTVTGVESVELIGNFSDDPSLFPGFFTSTFGSGKAGDITVNTRRLVVGDAAFISSSSIGSGRGGQLTIKASDSVELSGASAHDTQPGGLFSLAFGSGPAGDLLIDTKQLIIRDGAWASSSTFGSGPGGRLIVNASELVEVKGNSPSGLAVSTLSSNGVGNSNDPDALVTNTGPAGDLQITTGQLIVRDGAVVTVANNGTGNAGNLEVQARQLRLDNAAIAGTTASGEGGNIFFKTQDVQLRHNSGISTTAGGTANGGNISFDADTLVVLESSKITANAFQGSGGNIQINTQGIFRAPNSKITASSQFGINGVVQVSNLGVDITNSLTPTKGNFISTEQVVAGSCLARRNIEQGKFTVTGTGGLPLNPYNFIRGRYELTSVSPLAARVDSNTSVSPSSSAPWKIGDPIVEATGIVRTKDGRILLSSTPQNTTPESANSLVCHPDNEPPKS